MSEIQIYLDALSFIIISTDILGRFGITLAVGAVVGAVMLDKFRFWIWIVAMSAFLILTQWQVNIAMHELGFTQFQAIQPLLITVISGFLFVFGAGTGYAIRKRFELAYTKNSPVKVATEIITEINGGEIEPYNSTRIIMH